jgi:hypothetical protein
MNPIQLLMQGVGAAPFAMPLINQGRTGSMLDQALQSIDSQKKAPDLGRQAGDALRGLVGLPPQVAPGAIISPQKQRYRTERRVGAMGVPYEARIPLEGTYGQLPPSINTNFAAYDESVTLPDAARRSAGNAGGAQSIDPAGSGYIPPFNPNQDLPASAEQSVDTAPFQHQMAIYEQGRNAAQTQAERNQVRDLGLAIHKAHNPQLYSNFQTPMASDRTFNPLMANTFPDAYPQTREAFIAEGGVQLPQTMNNVDARNEVVEGNRLEGERAAGELASSLEAQEFMKKFLAGRAGGK